jgi:hypothetical protein
MGDGDTFGEIAFFTEIPQIEAVKSLTVAKVLTIPRQTYQDITASFPINARMVLENLNEYVEAVRPSPRQTVDVAWPSVHHVACLSPRHPRGALPGFEDQCPL